MKTLVFCTGWSNSESHWTNLYGRWLETIRLKKLNYQQILIADDGSKVLPTFSEFEIISGRLPKEQPTTDTVMYHWEDNLGIKPGTCNYPGWYRSFTFAAVYAQRYGFEKVVHIEADAYLISKKIHDYVNESVCGWTAFYCPRHNFPEAAIQIIAGNSIEDYRQMGEIPYSKLSHQIAEHYIPFSCVQHGFIGDRYSEFSNEVPRNADYACQIHECFPCWWLNLPPIHI